MFLPNISKEQQQIIENIKQNRNVIVDAVAGSGKTTSILHIAQAFPEKSILVITYNSKLRLETKEKLVIFDIPNIEIHTYHSFCVNYYDKDCYDDNGIKKMLSKPMSHTSAYDLIVIDEAQDMTLLYFTLIKKIVSGNCMSPSLCILGDINQSIFQFNGADERFIKYAEKIFATHNNLPWSYCNLSTSYRITVEMSNLVNHCIGSNRINAVKLSKCKPTYIICNCFEKRAVSHIYAEVMRYLDMGYKPDDIFVLAPSVKNRGSPVTILENKLKIAKNIPIYVPSNDEDKIDADIMKHKMLFLSFHQSKGLERKVAIVFNFDQSYFDYYNKSDTDTTCSNTLYVAMTRASEQITLVHHYKNECFKFIDKETLTDYCEFYDYTPDTRKKKEVALPAVKKTNVGVTELLSFVPQNLVDVCVDKIELVEIQPIEEKIVINNKIQYGNLYESVSDITGIAMSIYFELMKNEVSATMITLCKEKFDEQISRFIKSKYIISNMINQTEPLTIDQILYISNCWICYTNKYLFKFFQIKEYDWISNKVLEVVKERFENLRISDNCKSELPFSREVEGKNTVINGFIDCFDYAENNLFEFKCVNELKKEHYLQVVLYQYLIENPTIPNDSIKDTNNCKYYLFNILTNQLLQIKCSNAEEVVLTLLEHKTTPVEREDDETFIKTCMSVTGVM